MKITASKFPERAELGPLPCSDNPGLLYLHLHTAHAPLTPMTPVAKPSREEGRGQTLLPMSCGHRHHTQNESDQPTTPSPRSACTLHRFHELQPRHTRLLFVHCNLHRWHLSHPQQATAHGHRRSTGRIEVLLFRRSSNEGETKREVFLCAKEGREEGAACIKHQLILFGRDCQCL